MLKENLYSSGIRAASASDGATWDTCEDAPPISTTAYGLVPACLFGPIILFM